MPTASSRFILTACLVPLLAMPAVALPLPSESEATRAFLASDVAGRLRALMVEPLKALPVARGEVVLAYYIPKQGALSEWDNETRLDQYHWDGKSGFQRRAFITKAGRGLKGRMAAWMLRDLDGDGTPELIAIGQPVEPLQKVTAAVFRQAKPDEAYKLIWKRQEFSAAVRVNGPRFEYTYQDRNPPYTRHFEHFVLVGDEMQPR